MIHAAVAAQLADLLAWMYATSHGAVESNPLMGGPLVPVIKLIAILALIVTVRYLSTTMQRIVLGIAIVLGVMGVITGALA